MRDSPIRRAFAGVDLILREPFIHLDQMGEVESAPGEPKGTNWHPHCGFEPVTYMIDGVLQHQDSTGGGVITGELDGDQGPVSTQTPMHATSSLGAAVRLPWPLMTPS